MRGPIFLVFLTKHLSMLPSPTFPSALKNVGHAPALIHYSFCKTLRLKCLRMF